MNKFKNNFQKKPTTDWKVDFSKFFGSIIPNIILLKKLGHIGSILTQYFVIQLIIDSRLSEVQQTSLVILSIIIAIGFSLFIEKGFDSTVRMSTKQIVRRKFDNSYYKIMFFIIGLASLFFLFYSPVLSASGGEIAGTNLINDYEMKSDDDIISKKNDEITELKKQKSVERKSIVTDYDAKIKSERKKYSSKINYWNKYYEDHKELDKQNVSWAKGHMNKAVTEKNKVIAKRNEIISNLESKRSDELLAIDKRFNDKVSKASDFYSMQQNQHFKIENAKYNKRNSTQTIFGWLGKGLGAISVFTCLVCIIILEIYSYAIGENESKEVFKPKHKWEKLNQKINNLFDVYFWEKLLGIDIDGDSYIGKPHQKKFIKTPKKVLVKNPPFNVAPTPPHTNTTGYSLRDIQAATSIGYNRAKSENDNESKNNANVSNPVITENANDVIEKNDRYEFETKNEVLHKNRKKISVTEGNGIQNRNKDAIHSVLVDGKPRTYRDIKNALGNYINKLGNNTITVETFEKNISKWMNAGRDYFEKYPGTPKGKFEKYIRSCMLKANEKRKDGEIYTKGNKETTYSENLNFVTQLLESFTKLK